MNNINTTHISVFVLCWEKNHCWDNNLKTIDQTVGASWAAIY